ncbi:hypothetical protein ACHAWF_009891 [Thalassiosira exigua]
MASTLSPAPTAAAAAATSSPWRPSAPVSSLVGDSDARHEFLVTYEGPIGPGEIGRERRGDRGRGRAGGKVTFALSLPPSGVVVEEQIERGPSYVLEGDLLARLSERVGWPPSMLSLSRRRPGFAGDDDDDGGGGLLFPLSSLVDALSGVVRRSHPPISATIRPRLTAIVGGKGGFGTLLKAQSKQGGAKATLDFGACRDLSGRRLRHVNDEIKLRKFRELQERRARGEEVDELEALKTPSGIRNWHLMVPAWSDGVATSKKGRRRMERNYGREVRGWKNKEERARREAEERRTERERAVDDYVRRGEEEARRAGSVDLKQGILEHLRKRKLAAKSPSEDDAKATPTAAKATVIPDDGPAGEDDNLVARHLLTLSGEMSVLDIESKESSSGPLGTQGALRLQSRSDFATAVVLLDAAKLDDLKKEGKGVYLEYTLKTAGLAQIGWARPPGGSNSGEGDIGSMFLPNSDTGDGVGDDAASYGYDGSRGLQFHDGKEVPYGPSSKGDDSSGTRGWKAGDVLGCRCAFLDGKADISYMLNGTDLGAAFSVSSGGGGLLYPAASLNLGEELDVRVGPEFVHGIPEGCVGAWELVGTGAQVKESSDRGSRDGVGEDGVDGAEASKEGQKPPSNDTLMDAPPRKRPRERQTDAKPANDDESTRPGGPGVGSVGTGGVGPSQPSVVPVEAFDLAKCSSVEELREMGPDRLKDILLSMGIKCGGMLDERAARLFSLKGLRREEYPRKVRGKNFVP